MSIDQAYTSGVIVYRGLIKLSAQRSELETLREKVKPLKLALDQAMEDNAYATSPEFKNLALTKPGISEIIKTDFSWAGEDGAAIKKHAENLQRLQF
jgi:hypothetical protein